MTCTNVLISNDIHTDVSASNDMRTDASASNDIPYFLECFSPSNCIRLLKCSHNSLA